MSIVNQSAIQGGGSRDNINWSFDAGNETDPVLLIAVWYGDTYQAVDDVTVDAESAAFIGIVPDPGGSGGSAHTIALYQLAGVTGEVTVDVQLVDAAECWAACYLLDGRDQSDPVRDFGGEARFLDDGEDPLSATLDCDEDDDVLSFVTMNNTSFVPESNGTVIHSGNDSDYHAAYTHTAASPTVSPQVSTDNPVGAFIAAFAAVSLRPASAGASVELGGEESEAGTESSAGTFLATSVFAFTGVEALSDSLAEGGTFVGTSPAIRVDDVLQDTDSGELIDIESAEVVVLGGTPGSRTIVTQNATFEVADGVVEIPGAYTLDAEYLVALVESSERMSILPATVVDRND